MPVDFRELEERVLTDIEAEKAGGSQRELSPEERRCLDEYSALKDKFPGQPIYALVVELRCPWDQCGAQYVVAKFLTKKQGEMFFFYCHKCQEVPMTLRDVTAVHGNNTYPVRLLQSQMRKYPGKYLRWMNMLRYALTAYQEFAAKQPKHRARTLMPESEHGRAIKMRTSFVEDEDDEDLYGVATR
jgi:hypothetical protein